MKTVTATEANQQLSRILARVARGETVTITRRGKIFAKVMPASEQDEQRAEARRRLIERLQSQPIINIPRGTRDELYDDD